MHTFIYKAIAIIWISNIHDNFSRNVTIRVISNISINYIHKYIFFWST